MLLWNVQFCQVGVGADDIGVITPYQQQVRLLRETLKTVPQLTNVEVNTVDQYQGRDKSVVIISFVKSSRSTQNVSFCDARFIISSYMMILSGSRIFIAQCVLKDVK